MEPSDDRGPGIAGHPWKVVFGGLALSATLSALFGRTHTCKFAPPPLTLDLIAISDAIAAYVLDHDGHAPASLEELIAPDAAGNRYLSCTRIPRDPWNREYVYIRGGPPNVISYGRDGVPGGTGDDADIDLRAIAGGR